MRNRRPDRNSSSKYIGVSWGKKMKKWNARIVNEKIGWFSSEEEAARAYDKAAIEKFGDFANLNFKEVK